MDSKKLVASFAVVLETAATMGWDCGACTFHNASDIALTCEICTALRPGKDKMIVDLTADSQAWDFSTTERDNDVPSAASTSAVVSSKQQANSGVATG